MYEKIPDIISLQIDAGQITAIGGATVIIIGAIIAGIIQIVKAIHDTAETATKERDKGFDSVKKQTDSQNKTLGNIEILVDGRYSEVLQELADLKLAFFTLTNKPADKVLADNAQRRADDQAIRVTEHLKLKAQNDEV